MTASVESTVVVVVVVVVVCRTYNYVHQLVSSYKSGQRTKDFRVQYTVESYRSKTAIEKNNIRRETHSVNVKCCLV